MTETDPVKLEHRLAGPVSNGHHLARAPHPSPNVIKQAMGEVDGFNAKFAVLIPCSWARCGARICSA
jgi:hypothetical protein